MTGIKISKSNAAEIVQAGRLRWKIENEGFNTQKNPGYNLEHKYSRVSWLAAKNYYQCLQIGHLINQLLELGSKFRELLKGKITILSFSTSAMLLVAKIEKNRGRASNIVPNVYLFF